MSLCSLTERNIVRIALLAIVGKAILLFGIFPFLIEYLGNAYQGQLFPDNYDLIASNLANGRGYRVYAETSPTMLRTPGFVLILSGVFSIAGENLVAVQVLHFLLSIVTSALVYILGVRIYQSVPTATIAALIAFFHPGTILAETRGGLETTLTLAITALLLLCFRALESMRIRDYVALGFLFGLALLVKSSVALILPAIISYVILRKPFDFSSRVLFWNVGVATLTIFVVLMPWIARNHSISGKFIPTMTVSGLAQFQGAYVAKNLGDKDLSVLLHEATDEQMNVARQMGLRTKEAFFPQFYSVDDEVYYYDRLGQIGRNAYIENPRILARAIVHNSWAFWFKGRTSKATTINLVLMLPFLVLFVLGAYRFRRDWRAISIVLSVLAFLLPHLLILATTRYSVPLIPIMSVLAAVPISRWLCAASVTSPRAGVAKALR